MPGDRGLIQDVRPASAEVTGQQRELFAFDAFEYEDPNKNNPAKITVKEGWKLNLQRAVIGDTDLSTEGGFLNLDLLDVNEIFAQDITATGTITGATIIGGAITGGTITGSTITGGTITGNTSISIGPFNINNQGIITNLRFGAASLWSNKNYTISSVPTQDFDGTSGIGIEGFGEWVRFSELTGQEPNVIGNPSNFFADKIAIGRDINGSYANSELFVQNIIGRGGVGITLKARGEAATPKMIMEINTLDIKVLRTNGTTVVNITDSGITGAVFN
jgi:hypothetical protein